MAGLTFINEVGHRTTPTRDYAKINANLYANDFKELSPGQIRLGKLRTCDSEGPNNLLSLDIIVVQLEDGIFYNALSYVWGDPTNVQCILCNGLPFWITQNLLAALRRLQNVDTFDFFWADAICINQQSVDERSQQVKLMGKIYSQAQQVRAWLGPADLKTKVLVDVLQSCPEEPQDWVQEALEVDALDDDLKIAYSWLSKAAMNKEFGTAMKEFYSNPWFDRVWIQQEAAMNFNVTLMYGEYDIPWSSVLYLALMSCTLKVKFGVDDSNILDLPHVFFDNIRSIEAARAILNHERWEIVGQDFGQLLNMARDREATDKRDYIYAMLHLVTGHDNRHYLPEPDYRLTTDEVYLEAAQCMIRMNTLGFLDAAGWDSHRGIRVPSWCPDYSQGSHTYEPESQTGKSTDGKLHGGSRAAVSRRSSDSEESAQHVLLIHGALVDHITWVTRSADDGDISKFNSAASILPPFTKMVDACHKLMDKLILINPSKSATDLLMEVLLRNPRDIVALASNTRNLLIRINLSFEDWTAYRNTLISKNTPGQSSLNTALYDLLLNYYDEGYQLCLTENGRVCVASAFTRNGDDVAEFFGVGTGGFYALRPKSNGFHELIGHCNVHGLLQGNLSNMASKEAQMTNQCGKTFRELYFEQFTRGVFTEYPPGWIAFHQSHDKDLILPLGWVHAFDDEETPDDIPESYYYHEQTILDTNQEIPTQVDDFNRDPFLDLKLLPAGWKYCEECEMPDGLIPGRWPCFYYAQLDIHTRDDPRYTKLSLGPMIQGWCAGEQLINLDDDMEDGKMTRNLHFIHVASGKVTREDPCLCDDGELTGFAGLRLI